MNRPDAFALLSQYTKNDALVKHMLAVEAAMRAYARKYQEDEDVWGITGLLHDFDYEMYPDPPDHPHRQELLVGWRQVGALSEAGETRAARDRVEGRGYSRPNRYGVGGGDD